MSMLLDILVYESGLGRDDDDGHRGYDMFHDMFVKHIGFEK